MNARMPSRSTDRLEQGLRSVLATALVAAVFRALLTGSSAPVFLPGVG